MWDWQSPADGIGNLLWVGLAIPENLLFGIGNPLWVGLVIPEALFLGLVIPEALFLGLA